MTDAECAAVRDTLIEGCKAALASIKRAEQDCGVRLAEPAKFVLDGFLRAMMAAGVAGGTTAADICTFREDV